MENKEIVDGYDYISVNSRNLEELDKKVTKLLNEGYRLYGYPYVTATLAVQTMIRTPMVKIGEVDEQ